MIRPYPVTRIEYATDTLAGISYPDPYRWLEGRNEEVRAWQRQQAELAGAHVREWPHFGRLQRLVAFFNTERYVTLPHYAGGRWFRMRASVDACQAQVVVSDEPMGEGRILFDPVTLNPDDPPFLSWIAPSPDGRTLALGVCADGSENNTIRLIDVSSGEVLAGSPPQTLMDNWTGGVQWLTDSSGFFFTAITGPAVNFEQTVLLHRHIPRPGTVMLDIPWTGDKDYRMILVDPDGRHAVAMERLQNPIPVAVANLGQGAPRWRPFITSIGGTVSGRPVHGTYFAVTDVGAPHGRLVEIPLDEESPDDPGRWREIVPESDAVLRTVTPVGDLLYLTELVDAQARIRIIDRGGDVLGTVPLPCGGAVAEWPFPMMNLVPRGHPGKHLFGFSSLTLSPAVYCHTPGTEAVETLQSPKVQLKNTVVEDRWATSVDGTRIPYHLVRRADVSSTQPLPTLIYGYGGYNVPLVPRFPGPMAAFIAAGGIFVHAHLRGGGEFGLSWWQGGRMGQKQNAYDDLYAIAEDLIAAGCCTPATLAVTGGSNGGLLAGAAATQRPELWAVAVPRVPMLDLIGACRDPYGRQSITEEMADIENPEDVRRLATLSPYHLVREGIAYPAVFLDAGDTDPRCPPWHARKLAARLQAATAGNSPILLHVWEKAGHGWATAGSTAIAEHTEWLAFTLRHLGVDTLPPETDSEYP